MKNYRVQDGCWNCANAIDIADEYEIAAFGRIIMCAKDDSDCHYCGICDLYEKEDQ